MKNKKGSSYIVIGAIILVLIVIGVFIVNTSKNKNISEEISSNNVNLENETINEEVVNPVVQEKYTGDIHLQIGVSENDFLKISLNNKEVFNSEKSQEKGNFQIQVFDTALVGNNKFNIEFKDNEDDQPLVFFVIKDGVETIYNWEPNGKTEKDSFEVTIE